jgi:hypothetical protein
MKIAYRVIRFFNQTGCTLVPPSTQSVIPGGQTPGHINNGLCRRHFGTFVRGPCRAISLNMATPRFGGTADELYEILKKCASENGASFCRYRDESAIVTEAKLVHGDDGVEGHLGLLTELHSLQANLSFTKVLVDEALGKIFADFKDEWKMKNGDLDDWRVTLQRRIRNLCRCVSQGGVKSAGAQWVKNLPWNLSSGAPASSAASSVPVKKKPAIEVPYKYEFDMELLLPVRIKPGGAAEPGLPLATLNAEGSSLDDEVVAEWPDGHTAKIPGMTYGKVELLTKRGCKHTGGTGDLFASEHVESKNNVCIKQKVDRRLLLVVYEQTHQILMVKLADFGKIEDERHQVLATHPACVGGLAFLKPLIEKYCRGEIKKTELPQKKGDALKELGIKTRSAAGVCKRPAAAVQDDGAAGETAPGQKAKKLKAVKAEPEAKKEEATALKVEKAKGTAGGKKGKGSIVPKAKAVKSSAMKAEKVEKAVKGEKTAKVVQKTVKATASSLDAKSDEDSNEEATGEPEEPADDEEESEEEEECAGSSLPSDWEMPLPCNPMEAQLQRFFQ